MVFGEELYSNVRFTHAVCTYTLITHRLRHMHSHPPQPQMSLIHTIYSSLPLLAVIKTVEMGSWQLLLLISPQGHGGLSVMRLRIRLAPLRRNVFLKSRGESLIPSQWRSIQTSCTHSCLFRCIWSLNKSFAASQFGLIRSQSHQSMFIHGRKAGE